jgi:putative peptidoglycan lipid II flippase
VNLLYGRGDFDGEATRQTIFCLWGYGVGLLPYVFVLLLAPAFYARKNFRIPMRAAVLSMGVNVALNALFVLGFQMGAMSIALATSLSAWFNFIYLSKGLPSQKMFETGVYKGALVALIAGGVTFLLGHYLAGDKTLALLSGEAPFEFARCFKDQALSFFVLSGVFCLTFISYAWLLDVKEVLNMLRIPRRQKSLSS